MTMAISAPWQARAQKLWRAIELPSGSRRRYGNTATPAFIFRSESFSVRRLRIGTPIAASLCVLLWVANSGSEFRIFFSTSPVGGPFRDEPNMFKVAAVAFMVLLGADQFLNHGQASGAAAAMLKQIARAYGI